MVTASMVRPPSHIRPRMSTSTWVGSGLGLGLGLGGGVKVGVRGRVRVGLGLEDVDVDHDDHQQHVEGRDEVGHRQQHQAEAGQAGEAEVADGLADDDCVLLEGDQG